MGKWNSEGKVSLYLTIYSLYRSLYESAIQYYNNRIKKARKKRAKLPPPATSARQSLGDSNEPQPLSVQGWMLRYDYKAAFFQEMRQDVDGATKYVNTSPISFIAIH